MARAHLLYAAAIVSVWRRANCRRYPKTASLAGDLSGLADLGVLYWGLLYIPLAAYLLLSQIVRIAGWNDDSNLHPAAGGVLLSLAGVTFVASILVAARARIAVEAFADRPKLILAILGVATIAVMPVGQAITAVVAAAATEKAEDAIPLAFATCWAAGIAIVCSSLVKGCVDIWRHRLKAACAR